VEPELEKWDRYPGRNHDEVEKQGAEFFVAAHESDYVPTERNAQMLLAWCHARKTPASAANLQTAFRALWSLLDKEEPRDAPPAVDLSKLADDPSLSSYARKQRFAKLKQAAVAERIHLANARRPRGTPWDLGG
jgi:hypothetical protein